MPKSLAANLYNPHEQSKEQLLEHFVARHELFGELYNTLKNANDRPPLQHYLIEGQRGMGKTTLLLRLGYEIDRDSQLRESLIPVILKEEAYYGIRRLFHLWETIACELAGKNEVFATLSDNMSAAYGEQNDYERRCFEILRNALRGQGKRLVLFVDNLGELLRNFSIEEQTRLYNLLRKSPYLRVVGATAIALRAYTEISSDFLPLFEISRLEGLGKSETHELLLQLGRAYEQNDRIQRIITQQPGRIESLRILTGGVIRTMVLLFEVFCDQEDGNTLADLDTVLDRVTPLYKSRMDDLTPLQREVVNTLALQWEAMSVEEIVHKARLSIDEVAAILHELENVFIIEQIDSDGSQPLYRLKERFFNIWYLMRLSSGQTQSRVVWLVHFLESWYSAAELQQHAKKHTQALVHGQYQTKAAYSLTEALVQAAQLDRETEHQMILAARKLLEESDAELAAELSPSDKELFSTGEKSYQQEAYEEALKTFTQLKHKNKHVHFRLGYAFSQVGDYEQAVNAFSLAAEQGHLDALISLGQLYHRQYQDMAKAEEYYRMAAEHGRTDAMLYLGNIYHYHIQELLEAEKHYLMAVRDSQVRSKVLGSGSFSLKGLKNYLVSAIKGETDDPERYQVQDFPGVKEDYMQMLEHTAAEAMFQLGILYSRDQARLSEAERFYQMSADVGHAKAMLALADLYNYRYHDNKKAERLYTNAANKGNVTAMVNLAFLYHDVLKNNIQAEKFYSMAAGHGDVSAMNGLAWLYFEQKREKERALQFARQVIETEKNIYTAHTSACIYLWNNLHDEAIQLAEEFMYSQEAYQAIGQDILFYLILLLAKRGEQQLITYFETPGLNLHERFQPLYYALLYLLQDENYRKCPPELNTPVQDILHQMETMRKDYV